MFVFAVLAVCTFCKSTKMPYVDSLFRGYVIDIIDIISSIIITITIFIFYY